MLDDPRTQSTEICRERREGLCKAHDDDYE